MQWSTACPDWEDRILHGRSLVPFPPLFPGEAAAALEVLKSLRIVDAPGSPLMRDACLPWIFDFASAVFGSYDHEIGKRLIVEYLLLISKKNTKSTTAAAIMLTALIRNWRRSAEYLILAPTKEIANNSFYPARDMVRADAELSDLMHVQEHVRTITHRVTKATLKVIAAEDDTVGGKKATGVLVDEVWLFGKQKNAEDMLREATGGLASRPEGFVIYLSTQSNEPPAGVFKQKLQYARSVRDGRVVDPSFLPILYEFPEWMLKEKLHRDPRYFHVTNPNLGVSVQADFLARELAKAEEAGEESVRGFLAKHLNVEIGLSLRSDRWSGAEFWEGRGNRDVTLDLILEACDAVCIGIDGGGLDDLLGLAVLGRDRVTREWLLWNRAWAHKVALDRRKQEAPRLRDFQAASDLTIVDEVGQDVVEVADIVQRVYEAGILAQIGVDPVGIGAVVDEIVGREVPQDMIVGVPQGWKLAGAIKTVERALAAGTLTHAGQALMAWNVGNAKVEPRGNAVMITKQLAGAGKIDALMATFNAAALLSMNPVPREPSVLEDFEPVVWG